MQTTRMKVSSLGLCGNLGRFVVTGRTRTFCGHNGLRQVVLVLIVVFFVCHFWLAAKKRNGEPPGIQVTIWFSVCSQ